jgi:hypothetical protein
MTFASQLNPAARQRIVEVDRRMRAKGLQPGWLQPKAIANWTRVAWGLPTFRVLAAWVKP